MKCYDKTSSEIVRLSFCTGPSTFFRKDEMSLSYCWNCVCRCFLWKNLLKQRSTVMNSPKPGKARVCMEFSKPRDSWQHPPGQISMSYAVILSLMFENWGFPSFPENDEFLPRTKMDFTALPFLKHTHHLNDKWHISGRWNYKTNQELPIVLPGDDNETWRSYPIRDLHWASSKTEDVGSGSIVVAGCHARVLNSLGTVFYFCFFCIPPVKTAWGRFFFFFFRVSDSSGSQRLGWLNMDQGKYMGPIDPAPMK